MRFRFVGAGLAPALASHFKIIATTPLQMDFAGRKGSASIPFDNNHRNGKFFAVAQRQVQSHAGGLGNDQMRTAISGATDRYATPESYVNSRLR